MIILLLKYIVHNEIVVIEILSNYLTFVLHIIKQTGTTRFFFFDMQLITL